MFGALGLSATRNIVKREKAPMEQVDCEIVLKSMIYMANELANFIGDVRAVQFSSTIAEAPPARNATAWSESAK